MINGTIGFSFVPFRITLPKFPGFPNNVKLPSFGNWQGFGKFGAGRGPPSIPFLNEILDDSEKYRNGILMAIANVTTRNNNNNNNKSNIISLNPNKNFMKFSLKEWIDNKIANRRGLLVWLLPALYAQMVVLRAAFPFVYNRMMQYIQPELVALSLMLSTATGSRVVQTGIWTSVFIGTGFMFYDTLAAGAGWLAVTPSNDSYAIVTGASSGLGKAIAIQLHQRGYKLILIARRIEEMDKIRSSLIKTSSTSSSSASSSSASSSSSESITKSSSSPASYNFDSKINNDNNINMNRSTNSTTKRILSQNTDRDSVILIPIDLRDPEASKFILNKLKEKGVLNKVDVLVNNAGIADRSPFLASSTTHNTDMIDVNIHSTVSLIRDIAPMMTARGRGRIMIISSIAGEGPGPGVAVYAATKAFLSSFAK
eukprot:gene8737-18056_t